MKINHERLLTELTKKQILTGLLELANAVHDDKGMTKEDIVCQIFNIIEVTDLNSGLNISRITEE